MLPSGKQLYLGGCDISQFYNRLEAPEFLIPFLGLPRVRSATVNNSLSSEFVVLCLTYIPKGATFAVSLAQTVSLSILRRARLQHPPLSRSTALPIPLREGQGTQLAYIDDLISIGTDKEGLNSAVSTIVRELQEAGLPVEGKKTQLATEGVHGEALGLRWWQDGVLTVKPGMAVKLYSSTEEILRLGRATPHRMQSPLGSWTWASLLRRNLLSIFSDVYELASAPKPFTTRPLSATQRLELEMCLDLFSLMYVNLRRPLSTRVYASDASKSSGGVVYSDLDKRAREQFVRGIEEKRVRKGWYSNLKNKEPVGDCLQETIPGDLESSARKLSKKFSLAINRTNFKVPISTAWKSRKAHINKLELEAGILAVRHMQRPPVSRGHRVVLLIDSTSVLGAIAKGRSS